MHQDQGHIVALLSFGSRHLYAKFLIEQVCDVSLYFLLLSRSFFTSLPIYEV